MGARSSITVRSRKPSPTPAFPDTSHTSLYPWATPLRRSRMPTVSSTYSRKSIGRAPTIDSGRSITMTISRRDAVLRTLAAAQALAAAWSFGARKSPGKAPWQLPPQRQMRVVENEWIPMADGARLGARLWIPEGAERAPVPVVLEYIPYRKRDAYRGRDDRWGPPL